MRLVGQMGQVGRGENFELGTSCKLAPAGFTLKTLTNSESLPKGVAHGCDRGGLGYELQACASGGIGCCKELIINH